MRYFIVDDRIEKKQKKFYNFPEAKQEAERIMSIYIRLNNKVKMIQKDANFYIYLEKEEKND